MSELDDQVAGAVESLLVRSLQRDEGERWFSLVAANDVGEGTRSFAAYVNNLAALELGVEPPHVVFFRSLPSPPAGGPDARTWQGDGLRGLANTQFATILVRTDQSLLDLAETVAHEVSHVAQGAAGPTLGDREEATAIHYGLRMRARIEAHRRLFFSPTFPWDYYTLAGEADADDLLMAPAAVGDVVALYQNLGSRSRPRWLRISKQPRGSLALISWRLSERNLAALRA